MDAGTTGAGTAAGTKMIEPSIGNALPHFAPLVVFPLVACAALWGGWWIALPIVLLSAVEHFDNFLGVAERNIDPDTTHEKQLFLYKLSLWLWAVAWPVTFVFALWQILVSGHLATWEVALMAPVLAGVGQSIFIVGHELVHRRAAWERRLGELLLACASYPHYATEHIYMHHPLVCTPGDPGSAPRGVSLWQYLPREIWSNLAGAWKFERARLARRRLPAWHYTNPFWRYVLQTGGWYALVFWMGGLLAVLVYAGLCFIVVFSMKVSNYVQHYGLRRIRLPGGRYETVKARHAWSADYKFSNWFYFNMQRHADHHAATNRRYPLLQHHGGDESPQLPGTYVQMGGLAMSSKRWFQKMDPLLDRQRAYFYPDIEDWSAYDSPAYAAKPDAFEAIAEIHAAAPRMAGWINRSPALLDSLRETGVHRPRSAGRLRPRSGIRGRRAARPCARVLDQGARRIRNAGATRRLPGAGRQGSGGGGPGVVERQGVPGRHAYHARQSGAGRGGGGAVQRRGCFHVRRAVGRRRGFRRQRRRAGGGGRCGRGSRRAGRRPGDARRCARRAVRAWRRP